MMGVALEGLMSMAGMLVLAFVAFWHKPPSM
jgi:hypothetical protein